MAEQPRSVSVENRKDQNSKMEGSGVPPIVGFRFRTASLLVPAGPPVLFRSRPENNSANG